jgi:predicted O-linked N-acetylglucosamine transferase (SPINDLY family)
MRLEEARALLEKGRYREAVAEYSQLLKRFPEDAALLCEIGLLACLLGDLDGGADLFLQAVQKAPGCFEASRRLAASCLRRRDFTAAAVHASRALEGMGEDPALLEMLARIMEGLRDSEASAEFERRADALEPAGLSRAAQLIQSGQTGEALVLLEKSRREGTVSRRFLSLYGTALRQLGRLERACAAFREAAALALYDENAFYQLGLTLSLMPRSAEAAACLKSALHINPAHFDAQVQLGVELLGLDLTAAAVSAFEKALKLRPDNPAPLRFLAAAQLQSGRQPEAVATLRLAVDRHPSDAPLHSQLLAALNYLDASHRGERFSEFRAYAAKFEQPVKPLDPVVPRPEEVGRRRLRVGYVSGDFRNHSVAFFVEPLLRVHDRKRFEVFCYMTRPQEDAVTRKLKALASHWRPVASLSSRELAQVIRADRIDVLVDLSSHTAENRLPAFVLRPAPVQVTMIGLMQTTGLDSVDYRITDSFLDPAGESEPFNSEKLLRMESGPLVFQPPSQAPEVNPLPALSGAPLVLGCTNDLEKVTDRVRSLWARLLKALPESRFLFFGRQGNHFVERMGELGVGAGRFIEVRRKPLPEFLAEHHRIDFALDPFPYNGLTVTMLSSWMGVPCVTLEGNTPPARAAGAILRRLGFPEFVARTEDEYVALALKLAGDLPKLAAVRRALRARVRDACCDARRHVAELEAAFVGMVQRL